jgi:hypothetical protein
LQLLSLPLRRRLRLSGREGLRLRQLRVRSGLRLRAALRLRRRLRRARR